MKARPFMRCACGKLHTVSGLPFWGASTCPACGRNLREQVFGWPAKNADS